MEPVKLRSTEQRSSTSKNGRTNITIREEYENDETKTLTVRECENGYIIRIEHNYREKRNNGDGYEYKWDEKEYISTTNPLDKKALPKEEKKPPMSTKDVAASVAKFISSMSGKLSV